MCDVFYLLKNTKYTIHFRDLKLQYAWYFKQVYVFENGGQSTMGNDFKRYVILLFTFFYNLHIWIKSFSTDLKRRLL